MPSSPWRRIPLASIAGELAARIARLSFANLRRLDTSHGCQDHTVLPYAASSAEPFSQPVPPAKLLAKAFKRRYRFRSSGLRLLAATSHLVVAAGAGRRAAELRIASATQRGRTIRISVRIAVVRMQDDVRSSVPVHDNLKDNLNPVGCVFYHASTFICTPASLSQEVGLGLGAQAGESRLRQVATEAGFRRFRRATETPFNMIFEVRP